jgi:hypothetical protein
MNAENQIPRNPTHHEYGDFPQEILAGWKSQTGEALSTGASMPPDTSQGGRALAWKRGSSRPRFLQRKQFAAGVGTNQKVFSADRSLSRTLVHRQMTRPYQPPHLRLAIDEVWSNYRRKTLAPMDEIPWRSAAALRRSILQHVAPCTALVSVLRRGHFRCRFGLGDPFLAHRGRDAPRASGFFGLESFDPCSVLAVQSCCPCTHCTCMITRRLLRHLRRPTRPSRCRLNAVLAGTSTYAPPLDVACRVGRMPAAF